MNPVKRCEICGGNLPKGRRKFCSDACLSQSERSVRKTGVTKPAALRVYPPVPESERCPPDCEYIMSFPHRDDYPWHCGYILRDGNGSRGCPTGPECKRYKPKKRRSHGKNGTA